MQELILELYSKHGDNYEAIQRSLYIEIGRACISEATPDKTWIKKIITKLPRLDLDIIACLHV